MPDLVLFATTPGLLTCLESDHFQYPEEVQSHNLLTEAWTAERLRLCFGELPVAEWFNRAAPGVKSGEVVPEQMSENLISQDLETCPRSHD
jgi:hypothetical protein